jgi:hypothetical protein
MKKLLLALVALVILGVPAFAAFYNPKTDTYDVPPPTTKIEKNFPDDLYGAWCFVGLNDPQYGGINYRLPSWADTCEKNKILAIGRNWFEDGDISCHSISKIKVTVECAPSGCGTTATFSAECTGTPNRTWKANVTIYRYKGNLDLKGLNP